MKLNSISEGRLSGLPPIDQIVADLTGRILIVFMVKTTGPNPSDRHAQIISIAAVAIDGTGKEIDAFNQEASLNLATLRYMDLENRAAKAGKLEPGDMGVRDWLNAADYDIDEEDEKPEDIDIAIDFKSFIEQYAGQAILITHNAKFAMAHLNYVLPVPIRSISIIDTAEFIRLYFAPVLRSMADKGSVHAKEMAERMWDEIQQRINPSLSNLGKVLGVKKIQWHASTLAEEVRQLAGIFSKMLAFVQRNKDVLQMPEYRSYAAQALERAKGL